MSRFQRIVNIFIGIVMILGGITIAVLPEVGLVIVAFVMCVALIVYGIRRLVYYFTMARHMVGGQIMLFLGVVIIDLGLFVLTLSGVPHFYIMIYLLAIHGFSGAIEILRSLEAKRLGAPSWKFKLATGVVDILIAAACGVFIKSEAIAVYIFCAGIIYSGIARIISAFRRIAVIYIQ